MMISAVDQFKVFKIVTFCQIRQIFSLFELKIITYRSFLVSFQNQIKGITFNKYFLYF